MNPDQPPMRDPGSKPPRAVGRRTTDQRRAMFDRVLPVLVVSVLVLLLIEAVVSISVLHQQQRQTGTLVNGCQRLQLVRDDLNVQAWVQYQVISISQGGGTSAERQGEIAALLAQVDAPTRRLMVALLEGSGKAQSLYPRVLSNTRYGPPTDCHDASKNPEYRFPGLVPFSAVADCFDPETNLRPKLPCRTP